MLSSSLSGPDVPSQKTEVHVHRSSDHLVLLDRGVVHNPSLSYGAIGLYARLESFSDAEFDAFTSKHSDHPLLAELLAEGVYQAGE